MASILIGSLAIAGAAYGAKAGVEAFARYKARKAEEIKFTQSMPREKSDLLHRYAAHGFQPKMNRDEAALILGVEKPLTREKVKNAHRDLMLVNHPDRGGSTFLGSKINQAKEIIYQEEGYHHHHGTGSSNQS